MRIHKLIFLLLVSVMALSGCYTVRYVYPEIPEEEEDESAPDGFCMKEGDDWYVVIKPAKATIMLRKRAGKTTGHLVLAHNSSLLKSKGEKRFTLADSSQPWHEFVWSRTGETATGQLVNKEGEEVVRFECHGVNAEGSLSCSKQTDEDMQAESAAQSSALDASEIIVDSNQQTFVADAIDASQKVPVLVEFWADWCKPCKELGPMLEKAVKDAGGRIKLVRVDVDKNPELMAQLDVTEIPVPVVAVIWKGEVVDHFVGSRGATTLHQFIESVLETASGQSSEKAAGPDRKAFLELINALRADSKLPPVSYGECADKMAKYWASNENAPVSTGHSYGNDTLESRAKEFGCEAPLMENAAWPTEGTAEEIFMQWLRSASHKANMLKPGIKQIGLHCVKTPLSQSGHFCVLVGTG